MARKPPDDDDWDDDDEDDESDNDGPTYDDLDSWLEDYGDGYFDDYDIEEADGGIDYGEST